MKYHAFIYRKKSITNICKCVCKLQGAELPPPCNIGKNIRFPHGLKGIVLHPNTIIEDNVTIFHQVTCGRGDFYNIDKRVIESPFKGIVIKKGAILCAGSKIICNRGTLEVGENTVVGANAVLTKNTGKDEIWVGVPAHFLRQRDIK